MTGLIVGVDGGGSKTHAVALTREGEVVGRATGPGSSPHFVGVDGSLSIVDTAVRTALGGREANQVNVYLSGLDLESEVEAYADATSATSWATAST
ncbi:MAG: N-acetylglucosamine kinase, partial [Schumannella sp.]